MKFGDKERIAFKKELQQTLAALEKKYGVKIGMLKRESDPNYIGLSIKEAPAPAPTPAPAPAKPAPAKPAAQPAKPAPAPKKAEPKKPVNSDLDDLDNLDIDSLDFSDLDVEDSKPAPKKAEPKKSSNDDLDDLADLDIDSLDFSDLGAEEELLEAKKDYSSEFSADDLEDFAAAKEEAPKKRKSYDDDSRYDQELEKYLGSSNKSSLYSDPDNIFEEMKRENDDLDDDISEEELDAYLASSGAYSFSFQAKLIQGEGDVQDYYTDVKNLLLSYDGIKSKVAWDYDEFSFKGKTIAKIEVEKDTLYLYLRLDANDYDASLGIKKNKKYSDTQACLTIASYSDVDKAYDFIEDLSTEQHFYPGEDRRDDYHFTYETNDELIARGLIKRK